MTGGAPPDGDPAAGAQGPFRRLTTRNRVRAGWVYVSMALIASAIVWVSGVGAMWLSAVGTLVALAGLEFAGAWRMPITDMEAIGIARDAATFPVGQGSATLGYRGPLAKPVWQVMVYADTSSPDHQAVVTVDATNGVVTGRYEEAVDQP